MEIQVNDLNKERYYESQKIISTQSCTIYRMKNGILKKFRNDSYENIYDHVVREILILRNIRHPNIVQLKEIWHDQVHPSLVLEDNGIALWFHVARMTRFVRASMFDSVFIQILNAFNYLHSNNIIHRDVKATNILIKDGIVKVCDFGLSRYLTDDDMGSLAYTINYRPPEILVGNCNYGLAADMWALGCVMYDFITHEMLFGVGDQDETDDQIMKDILLEVPTTTRELEMINAEYEIPEGPKWNKISQLNLADHKICMIKRLLSIHPNSRPTARDCLLILGETPQIIDVDQRSFLIRKKIKSDLNVRYIMVLHILEIGDHFPVSPFVIASAVDIYDKFLIVNKNTEVDQTKLILYYIASVLLSSCIHDSYKLFPADFESVYNEKDIENAMKSLFKEISYDLDSVSLWQIVSEQINLGILEKTKEEHYWGKIKEMYLQYDIVGLDRTQVTQEIIKRLTS